MSKALRLILVTPERRLVDEVVDEAQFPGQKGYLGILPGHAPLLTELGVGEISFRQGRDVHYATIIGGYAEVLPERVTILAQIAELAEEIDLKRAREAQGRAEKRLQKTGELDTDWNRAAASLKRALVRQQVAAKGDSLAAASGDSHARS